MSIQRGSVNRTCGGYVLYIDRYFYSRAAAGIISQCMENRPRELFMVLSFHMPNSKLILPEPEVLLTTNRRDCRTVKLTFL